MKKLLILLFFISQGSLFAQKIELGQGYDRTKEMFLDNHCISYPALHVSPLNKLNYEVQISRNVQETVNAFSVEGSIPIYAVKVILNFGSRFVDSYLSTSVVSNFDFQAAHLFMLNPIYNPNFENINRTNPIASLPLCGDSYVQQITVGNRISAALTFDFESHADKKAFGLALEPLFIGPTIRLIDINIDSIVNKVVPRIELTQFGKPSSELEAMEAELNKNCRPITNNTQGFSPKQLLHECLQQYVHAIDFIREHYFKSTPNISTLADVEANNYMILDAETKKYSQGGLWKLQPEEGNVTKTHPKALLALESLRDAKKRYEFQRLSMQEFAKNRPANMKWNDHDRVVYRNSEIAIKKNLELIYRVEERCFELLSANSDEQAATKCLDFMGLNTGLSLERMDPVPWFD